MLNYDNDSGKEVINRCVRTKKLLVNPIVHWTTEEVWEFLDGEGIHHCCLYDEGFERLGCISCPMSQRNGMIRDFNRWPKYKQMYIRAFDRMLENRRSKGLPTEWETGEEVLEWWMQ